MRYHRRISYAALSLAIFMMATVDRLLAQCAMCRASISGSGNAALVKTLNVGIVVLLVPPVAIFCSFFVAAVRRRGESNDNQNESSDKHPTEEV